MARFTPSGMFRFLPFFLFLCCAAAEIGLAQGSTGKLNLAPKAAQPGNTVATKMTGLPLMFEQNIVQPGASGDFTARGNGYTLDLDSGKMSLRVIGQNGQMDSLAITFAGADRKASGVALDKLPTLTNYFIGRDRNKWRTGVNNYGKVRYAAIYPGVDVLFYGNEGKLEHDFVLAPNANPKSIVFEVTRSKSLKLNSDGDVVITTNHSGEFLLKKPNLYQKSGEQKVAVQGEYQLLAQNRVGFKIASYDSSRALTIDPVLVFGTYLGAQSNGSNGNAVVAGTGGDIYVVGTAFSDFSNLSGSPHITPVATPNSTVRSSGTVFVAKFAAGDNGSTLAWLSYIGGTGPDLGNAIAFDGTNSQVVIAGTTSSTSGFPTSSNAASTLFTSGTAAAFVAALDSGSGGTTKYYNTYVTEAAPNGASTGNGVSFGSTGNIFVAGATKDSNLTGTDCSTLVGAGVTNNSFVAELTSPANGTPGTFVNSAVFSGAGDSSANGLAVNGTDVFVVGQAGTSFPTDTPTPGSANLANQTITSPGSAAYFAHVVFVPAPGTCPTFSPSLANSRVYHDNGGAGSTDSLNAIAFQSATSLFVAGASNSAALSSLNASPTSTLPALTNSGMKDALVLHVNPANLTVGDASEVVAAKEIGGSNDELATGVSVDANGNLFIGGTTTSLFGATTVFPSSNGIPTLDNAIATRNPAKAQAGFVAELANDFSTTSFATLIGADTADSDSINGVAAATGANTTLKGGVVALAGTFHGLASTTPNTTASAFQTSVTGGAIANGSAYVGMVEYNGTGSGVNNFAAGTFPTNVKYGDAAQYTFAINVATTNDSILNIPAVAGLTNLHIDGSTDASYSAATNCTKGTGGITCIVPANASGSIVVDGTVAVSTGSITVSATLADAANNTSGAITETSTASAATLTITADPKTKVYGDTDPALTFVATGFVNGDTEGTVLTGALTRAAGETVAGSPYAITQGTLAANANYAISFTPANFTITPATLTVTADGKTKVYGQVDPALTFVATGFKFTDDASTVLTGALTRVAGESVAGSPYAITQGTLAANANYSISFTGANLTITTATLSITADPKTKVYGDTDPALTFNATGFANGDSAGTVLTGTLTRAPGETVAGNPYAITQGTLAASANYTISFTGANLTITPAPLTITADPKTKVYGDADPALTFVATGFKFTDNAGTVLTGALARNAGETVSGSPYAITQGTLVTNTNYTISFTGANFTITPAPLTITADPKTKVYGNADPALTFVATGFKFTDNAGTVLTGTLARNAGETVSGSPYAITQGILAANTNYTISFTGANFTITPAPLGITADPKTKVYGDADPSLTFVATGFKFTDNGGTVLTGSLTRAAGETVAGNPRAITQGTLVSNTNYTISFTGANFTITPAPLTITADPKTKVYGDADPALTFVAAGFKFTDNAGTVLAGALVRNAGETVAGSPYAITQGTLAANTNYTISFTGANLTITPATLTVTADSKTKIYGDADPALTFVATGFKFTDNAGTVLTGALTRTAGETVAGSPYAITQGTLAANTNYTISFTGSNLTITPATLTVTADSKTKIYGDADPALTFVATGFKFTDNAGTVLTGALTRTAGETVAGSPYAITQGTLAANTNYTISFTGSNLTITKRSLHLTPNAHSADKIYDRTASATVTFSDDRVNGDALTFSSTAVYADANAGTGKLVNISGIAVSGAASGNYTLASPTTATTTSDISTKSITVNVTVSNKTYDANTIAAVTGCTPNGIVVADTVTCSAATANFLTKDVGNGKTVTASGLTLGGNVPDRNNYSITGTTQITANITPAHLTVTANNKTRAYAAADPVFDATLSGFVGGEVLGSSGVAGLAACTSTAVTSSPVGSYPITCTAGTLAALNYDFSTFTPGSLNITNVTLTVTPNDKTRVYGAADPAFDGTVVGVQAGDNITATFSTTAVTSSPVGSYQITATLVDPGNRLSNYAVTSNVGTLIITKAPLTITPNDKTRTYGAANPAFDGSVVGVTAGDNISATFSTTATPANGIGNYAITSSVVDPGNRVSNYNVTQNTGTLAVTRAHLTVMAVNQTRLYGAANASTAFNLIGFQNGENQISANVTGSPTLSNVTSQTTAVGIYPITVVDAGNLSAPNYDFLMSNFANGQLTITPAHLTVTADSQSRVYGGVNPTLTATISNFVNGETLATSGVTGQAQCSTPAIVTSVVAQYPIDCTQNTLTAGNYDFPQFMQGQLTVTAAPLTVTANNKSRTYGAANPTLDGSLVGVTAGDNITASFSTLATPGTAIGTLAISAALNDPGNRLSNYSATNNPGTLTINPAPLTVTANAAGKVFGQTTNFVGTEFTTSGLLNADQVNSVSLASAGATAGSNVGTYPIVVTAPVGIGLTNYNPITLVNSTLTVSAATSSSAVTVPFTPGGNAAKYTFQAKVTPQFTGTPTGTVTFMDKGVALAAGDNGQSSTVTLVNGVATFTTTVGQLAAGQLHSITAVYNKDANFAAATSQVAASVFVAAAITTSSGAAIPAQTLQIANPTSQDVTYTNLQCSVLSSLGAVVQSTACTVNPSGSLLVPKNGSANASVQIATSNGSSAQPAPSSASLHMAFGTLALALPAVVFLPMAIPASTRRKLLRRKALTCIGILLLLAFAVASMGCGGGGFDNKGLQPGSVITNATPVGNYTVQVTATSSATGQPTALGSIPMTVSF